MVKRLTTLTIAALVAPAILIAQKTSYDYDKTADFASFKTYAHKDGTKVLSELVELSATVR